MGADTWCFKEYQFNPVLTGFSLETIGDKDSVLYRAGYHFDIDNLLEAQGIKGWYLLVPYFTGYNYDNLEKNEKEFIEECLEGQPYKGLEFIKSNNVTTRIEKDLPTHLDYLEFLINAWKDGFYLFHEY
ncbi:hypothetical protein C0Q44_28240 [Paenibacillus sp. PCH8]|uniref:hypothetical protein n=1 Tax=Paenibacillus sp. PCH8 TaxID=2066524 RepID=UPI000CF96864|nr:hypothetical protein [Paenibacillus sp. PCH8]PQP80306.1 hypothetical protein C0Q44_28240 [Paenibacillus sp. PCH8]